MFSTLLAMLVGLVDGSDSGSGSGPFLWMAGKVPRLPVDSLQIALEAGSATATAVPIATTSALSLKYIVVVAFPSCPSA